MCACVCLCVCVLCVFVVCPFPNLDQRVFAGVWDGWTLSLWVGGCICTCTCKCLINSSVLSIVNKMFTIERNIKFCAQFWDRSHRFAVVLSVVKSILKNQGEFVCHARESRNRCVGDLAD